MKLLDYAKVIEEFLRTRLKKTGLKGYILGISGGIDSALCAVLLKRSGVDFKCLLLPYGLDHPDYEIGKRLCERFSIEHDVIDIKPVHALMVDDIENNMKNMSKLTTGNMKARIRMTILYAYAAERNAMVVGTDNYNEYMLGYFTKYGDGGVDILPIVHLLKGEVRELSKLLGVPEEILTRIPSAGFYEGHSDEGELGFTYDVADKYFRGEKVDEDVRNRIEYLIRVSEHKRVALPRPSVYERTKNERSKKAK